jgi:hypothetical protein
LGRCPAPTPPPSRVDLAICAAMHTARPPQNSGTASDRFAAEMFKIIDL